MVKDWARPVVHWEIQAVDPDRLRAFYSELFNWDIDDGPIMSISPGIGGPEPGPAGHIRATGHSGVTLYVQVLDIGASLEKTKELGGSVTSERFQFPNTPTMAGITDPEGNPVMLIQQ